MRERFTDSEWRGLLQLPSVVFYTVALADGRADKREAEGFLKHVAASSSHPLLALLYEHLVAQGRGALKAELPDIPYPEYLEHTRELLEEKLSDSEYKEFLEELLGLGHRVAAASGGFFGRGKVSPEEQKRLLGLARALGVNDLLDDQEQ